MKIAFLNIYQERVARGAETYVRELSECLKKRHKVFVFSDNKLPAKRWTFIWRFFIDPSGLQIFLFTLKLLPKLWKEKYDIIISVNGGWQPAIIRILTWLYRGKMVIIGMSGIGWDDRNNLWSFPDIFIAISEKAKLWAKKANPFVKVEYIPGGVNIEIFKQSGKIFQHNLKNPVVLCVAALTRSKRIHLAINTIAQTKNISFLLEGRGELEEEIKSLGEKVLGERFKLINTSYDKLPEVYRSADLFTLPSSSSHSFELVLLEAMASGLPIVANDDPIRRKIVGGAGTLVDPVDIDSYRKAIEHALQKDWKTIPQKQAEKFSWEKISKQYENLLLSLLNKT